MLRSAVLLTAVLLTAVLLSAQHVEVVQNSVVVGDFGPGGVMRLVVSIPFTVLSST